MWALMFMLPLLGSGTEIPEPVLPAGVGVNIHFVTGHEKDLDMIAGAGFKFVRMDFQWGGIERSKGEYDWSGYEELLTNLEKRGLRAVSGQHPPIRVEQACGAARGQRRAAEKASARHMVVPAALSGSDFKGDCTSQAWFYPAVRARRMSCIARRGVAAELEG